MMIVLRRLSINHSSSSSPPGDLYSRGLRCLRPRGSPCWWPSRRNRSTPSTRSYSSTCRSKISAYDSDSVRATAQRPRIWSPAVSLSAIWLASFSRVDRSDNVSSTLSLTAGPVACDDNATHTCSGDITDNRLRPSPVANMLQVAYAASPRSTSARWARSRQRRSERRFSPTSITATDRTITASAETIAVSIGWLTQKSPTTTSEAATAARTKIARTAAVRRPGLSFGIACLIAAERSPRVRRHNLTTGISRCPPTRWVR
jgi:hypothetical protein